MGYRLPYNFDLLYDIKHLDHLYREIKTNSYNTSDLLDLMKHHSIPLPVGYVVVEVTKKVLLEK